MNEFNFLKMNGIVNEFIFKKLNDELNDSRKFMNGSGPVFGGPHLYRQNYHAYSF